MEAPKDEVGISPGAGNLLAGPNPGGSDTSRKHITELGDLRQESKIYKLTQVKRLPDEQYGGSYFYRIQGEDQFNWVDQFGTVTPDGKYRITVVWRFKKTDIDRKGADALIAQVMKTYEPTP